MGYNLGIGEGIIESDIEERYMFITVEHVELEEAPCWEGGDISGKSNYRYPSYSGMSTFCRESGLFELFYDKDYGLLKEHPGAVPIKRDDLGKITDAKNKWMSEHSDSEPGWGEDKDHILARLIWFEFWFKWALENCKNPTFYNS